MGLFSKKKTTVTTEIQNDTTVNVNPNIGVEIDVAGLGDILKEGQRDSANRIAGSFDNAGSAIRSASGRIQGAISSASDTFGSGFNLKSSAGLIAVGLVASAGLISVAIAR